MPSSGPTIQLGAVSPAARLRLGYVSFALALLYTAVQRDLSSGLTIQLGALIVVARLRLRHVIFYRWHCYTRQDSVLFPAVRQYSSVP